MAIKTNFNSVTLSGEDAAAFLRQTGLDREEGMIHEGERLEREIKRLERELEAPISDKKRLEIRQAINHLKDKKSSWARAR